MRRIEVVDYDPGWASDFINESKLIKAALAPLKPAIHHIGSTSVPGLAAKPIIDILVEIENITDIDSFADKMKSIGYIGRGEFGIKGRRYFEKGGDKRTHQIHSFAKGDFNSIRHIAFRDYLLAHREVADKYASLKKNVAKKCDNDIERYCEGKHEFVQHHEKKAVAWYALKHRIHLTQKPQG